MHAPTLNIFSENLKTNKKIINKTKTERVHFSVSQKDTRDVHLKSCNSLIQLFFFFLISTKLNLHSFFIHGSI